MAEKKLSKPIGITKKPVKPVVATNTKKGLVVKQDGRKMPGSK